MAQERCLTGLPVRWSYPGENRVQLMTTRARLDVNKSSALSISGAARSLDDEAGTITELAIPDWSIQEVELSIGSMNSALWPSPFEMSGLENVPELKLYSRRKTCGQRS